MCNKCCESNGIIPRVGGLKGDKGDPGEQGPQGEQGVPGATGAAGVGQQGAPGAAGAPGTDGTNGKSGRGVAAFNQATEPTDADVNTKYVQAGVEGFGEENNGIPGSGNLQLGDIWIKP